MAPTAPHKMYYEKEKRQSGTSIRPCGSGWNWIGYIPHVSISVSEALANVTNLATGDLIKSQRAYAQYIDGYGWVGSLQFMNPAEGYLLKTANTGSFTYPDYVINRESKTHRDDEPLPIIPGWELNPLAYEYSANITAVVQSGGITISDEYVLGAFVGDQCRGIAGAAQVLGSTMYFLTVYANTFNETLSFKLYDSVSQTSIDLPNTLLFVNNQVSGNPTNPYVLLLPYSPLDVPQNVELTKMETGINLSWSAVAGADYYKIYTSNDPTLPFESWIFTDDVLVGTQWTDSASSGLRFYRVTAVKGLGRGAGDQNSKAGETNPLQPFDIQASGKLPLPKP